MAGKRSTPEQIVGKLRQVEVLTAQGKPVAEAVRAIGVTETTYYRWRAEYGGRLWLAHQPATRSSAVTRR